jgi:tetratricopeptide (TPR) repeat protein
MQLGECYRALGQYKQALDTFSDILKEKESSLSVQRAAAYTYQQRGQTENPQWLERAIHGGYKLRSTGQNRIWGWLKISQVASRAARADEKYRDTFYEARANIARCRYLAAMKQSGAARERDLAKAKQSIQSLAQLYPDLGGERWRGEFDALLKQIQTAGGEKPDGLREFSAGQSQVNPNERRG